MDRKAGIHVKEPPPGAWVAETVQGEVRAFLALGDAMPYVPAAVEPELYVRVLIASRDPRVRGIGRRLMAFADEQARVIAATVPHNGADCGAVASQAFSAPHSSASTSRRPCWRRPAAQPRATPGG